VLTGKGALAQFGYEVGLDTIQVDWFIVALIGFNAIAAILPTSGTFVPEEQEALKERPKGSLQDPKITIFTPKKFFGIDNFGFSKANELFVGRVAQLGFAASLVGEVMTGKGPLAQFDFGEYLSACNMQEFEAQLLSLLKLSCFVTQFMDQFMNLITVS
jgi:photosystem II protein